MQDSSPEFTFATDGEPSDSSVASLARLLLDDDEDIRLDFAGSTSPVEVFSQSEVNERFNAMSQEKCCLCSKKIEGYGHNPEPLKSVEERCCDWCNGTKVIPARLAKTIEHFSQNDKSEKKHQCQST